MSAAAIAGDPGRVLHPAAPLPLAVVAARVGGDADPAADVEAADAGGPAELVARRTTAGPRRARCTSTGRRPTVWQASVWNSTLASRREARRPHRSAASCRARGSRAGRWRAGCRAAGPPRANRSRSTRPYSSTGTITTSKPSLSRTWQTPPTAGCSTALTTIRVPSSRTARTPPQIPSATDSVPPEVKTISSGCAPRADGHGLARVVEDPASLAARGVDVQRVAEHVERGHHGVAGLGRQRRRGRAVEVEIARMVYGVAGSLSRRNTPQYVTPATMAPATDPTIHTHQSSHVAGRQRRPEPPGRIHRGAGPRPERQDVEGDHEADREPGGLVERAPVVHRGAEDREDEEERGHGLDQDRPCRSRCPGSGRRRRRRGSNDEARASGTSAGRRRRRAPSELRDDVRAGAHGVELAGDPQPDRHRGVHHPAGQVCRDARP